MLLLLDSHRMKREKQTKQQQTNRNRSVGFCFLSVLFICVCVCSRASGQRNPRRSCSQRSLYYTQKYCALTKHVLKRKKNVATPKVLDGRERRKQERERERALNLITQSKAINIVRFLSFSFYAWRCPISVWQCTFEKDKQKLKTKIYPSLESDFLYAARYGQGIDTAAVIQVNIRRIGNHFPSSFSSLLRLRKRIWQREREK